LCFLCHLSHLQIVYGKQTSGQYLEKFTVTTTWQVFTADKCSSNIPVVRMQLYADCCLLGCDAMCSDVINVFHKSNGILKKCTKFYTRKNLAPGAVQLLADLSTRRPGIEPRLDHVGFVVNKVALQRGFLRVLRLSLFSIVPPMFHAHINSLPPTLYEFKV
jgi:hypothetical protein